MPTKLAAVLLVGRLKFRIFEPLLANSSDNSHQANDPFYLCQACGSLCYLLFVCIDIQFLVLLRGPQDLQNSTTQK
jgi:hypothetical protein